MNKRTIKAAVGASKISPAAARSAARYVYRDSRTGKLIVVKPDVLVRHGDRVTVVVAKHAGLKSPRKRTASERVSRTSSKR